jgi:ABC-type bacteriocin/lantibiotic exporter with double-glycine peptidase domain
MSNQAYRSRILHVTSTNPLRYEYLVDGVLLVEDGKIKEQGTHQELLFRPGGQYREFVALQAAAPVED